MTGRHGEPDTESERDRAATEPHGVELVGVAEATAVDGVDEVAVVDGGRVVTVVTDRSVVGGALRGDVVAVVAGGPGEPFARSEERRGGKECGSRWAPRR